MVVTDKGKKRALAELYQWRRFLEGAAILIFSKKKVLAEALRWKDFGEY